MDSIFFYIIQFALGGASVVGITLIAKYVNPKYTGIIYALPVILLIAVISIYLNSGSELARRTLKSTFVYEITLVYFILAFYLLINRVGFWWALGLALISWALIAFLIQLVLKG